MKNFWRHLPTPFTILAPMEGVTDVVFRQIITEIGKPDVFFTEFTNCDGIMSKGKDVVIQNLLYHQNEQPIVAQIWGINPKNFYETAKLLKEMNFSGIDINMGCPDKTVVKNGACSALMKNPFLAKEIIQATKEGAGGLPISVKTRLGFKTEQINEWIGFLLKQNISALSIHLRTVQELSKTKGHWELMEDIIKLRKIIAPHTLIIGNGDITSLLEGEEKWKQYGCEGYMIGRGIFTNPWVFNKKIKPQDISITTKLELYLHHIQLFKKTWETSKNPANLKKFCKVYINNFSSSSDLREKLMQTDTIEELEYIIREMLYSRHDVRNIC